jgi:isopentenyl-diphosphate delta-isomerase
MPDAVARRVGQELGAQVTDITLLLPDFRYQAVDASGVRENEVCPVFGARLEGTLVPDPGEVMEHQWVDPSALADVAARVPWLPSPWSATQIGLLDLSHLVAGNPAR